jgi:predicted RNA-binding protein YlqC (UPF0109 family)
MLLCRAGHEVTHAGRFIDKIVDMDMHEDKQFLENLVKALVDHPDAVRINRTVDEMGVLLTLDVHADDMGKIIGRSGNTAKAIRTLLRVVGMKHDARVNLKINEPEGGRAMTREMSEAMKEDNPVAETKTLDQAIEDLKI